MNDFPRFKVILGAVALWLFCIIVPLVYSQDRVLEYKPTAFEKKIIDAVSAAKSSQSSRLRYDDRIARAIGLAIDTLPVLSDSLIDLIFRPVGGFHRIIPLDSLSHKNEMDVTAEVIRDISQCGHYAIKTVSIKGRDALIVYYSDIYLAEDHGAVQGAGFSQFPNMANYYFVEYAATVNADSLRYILYKGDYALSPCPDSVVKDTAMPITQNRIKVRFEFEKMQFDIETANIYGFSHDRRCYDIIGLYLPVNHCAREIKRK